MVPRSGVESIDKSPCTSFRRSPMLVRPNPRPWMASAGSKPLPAESGPHVASVRGKAPKHRTSNGIVRRRINSKSLRPSYHGLGHDGSQGEQKVNPNPQRHFQTRWSVAPDPHAPLRKLLSVVSGGYIDRIAITSSGCVRRLAAAARKQPLWPCGLQVCLCPPVGFTAVAWLLLAAVTLAPTVARAQQRFSISRSPAQEYSRFRWSNSCASVPAKATVSRVVAVARKGAGSPVSRSLPQRHVSDAAAALPNAVLAIPSGLRAPP